MTRPEDGTMPGQLLVSKASLVTLSHAFEEACLHQKDPDRLVVSCFQQGRHFDRERRRYGYMAANSGTTIVLHADAATEHAAGYAEVTIPPGHPQLTAWNVLLVSPRSGAALVCQDLGRQLDARRRSDRNRAFLAEWSFDRHEAARHARETLAGIELPRSLRDRVEELLDRATEHQASDEERQMAVAFDHLVHSLESANLRMRAAAGDAARARVLAERDALTGTLNRTFLETWERTGPDAPMSAVLLDLDRFKAVNDTFGHGAGDQVLQAVGAELRAGVRTGDLVIRWGGDEFLVLLPDTSADDARQRADALLVRLGEIRFDAPLADYRVEASAGVGLLDGGDIDLETIDRALYAAKRAGGGVAATPQGSD